MGNIMRAIGILPPALLAAVVSAAGCSIASTSSNSRAVAATTTSRDAVINGPDAEGRAILAARDTLNRALRDRDVRPFTHFWLDNLNTTGGNGGSMIGRDANVQAFSRFFADSSFVAGMRTPERLDVGISSTGYVQAAESGHWVWRTRSARGTTAARGRYLVFWRRTSDGWRILSELYVTTACAEGCAPKP